MTWETLSPRVVMVARYDERDGIGRYAEQLMAAHSEGRSFLRLGIPEGAGDYPRAFHSGPRALWLLRDAGRRDDVVVQYHPHYYVRGGGPARVASYVSWGVAGLLRRVVLVVHEPDPPPASWLEARAQRFAWRRARQVVFHSEWERDRFAGRYGRGRRQEQVVVTHGDFFAPEVSETRAQARSALGLPADRVILLMIGFLSPGLPDKGYDRAIAAVEAAGEPVLDLRIVGSPIREGEDTDRLLASLRKAAESPQITLHEEFVDDEAFDRWIRAADAVLTPYRASSSSGVLARARMLGTPVITSDAGGLAEQAGPDDIVVHDDAELLEAVRRMARR
jgi:glycosyltransferase involved in cell wall biosynthesis